MPSKTEFYRQMADHVATQLTGSWQEWAGFLTTAARLYKYPFHEQLLIYAQRPDATACAEYDLWNEKMGRYVRRGSKGIALVDDSGDRPRLRYVFDISDTGTREHSRTPWLWQLEERHLDSVQAMLERTYDVSGDDLAGQLTEVAGKLAEEYWTEHQQDFFYIVDGSFLEEYDEYNICLLYTSHRRLFCTIVDDAVDHAVIVLYGHLCIFQRIFRQESGDLGKTNAVAVMTGYLTVLFDRNDVADAHGGTVKVYGFFQIELLIEFFQLLRHSARLTQRSGVDEVIIAAVYGNIMGL